MRRVDIWLIEDLDDLGSFAATARDPGRPHRRALVREVLAETVDAPAESLALAADGFGRPILAHRPEISLSLAHCDGYTLCAIARDRAVGVDLERIDARYPFAEVADRVLAAEERAEWLRQPDSRRRDMFFRLWTRKEAVLKALGLGLRLAPETIDVSGPADNGIAARQISDGKPVSVGIIVHDLAILTGHASAVAGAGAGLNLHLHRWATPAERLR